MILTAILVIFIVLALTGGFGLGDDFRGPGVGVAGILLVILLVWLFVRA